jgi:hypothetical protein
VTIDQFFEQMEAFYSRETESLKPIYKLRCWTADVMQDKEAAARHFEQWQNTLPGNSDDCPACQTAAVVEHWLSAHEVDKAIEAAEPIWRGKQRCRTVPASTFSDLLLPLLFTGKGEWAERLRRASFRQARRWPSMADHLARHVAFLSLTDRAKYARRPAIVMFYRLEEPLSDYHRLQIWRAGWIWSVALAKSGVLQVRVPAHLFEARMIELPELTARCRSETESVAKAFDERNGNDGWTSALARMAEFLEMFSKRESSGRA